MTTGKQYNDKFKSHLGEDGTKARKYCHMSGGPWCCAQVSLVYGETNKKLFYNGKYCTYCPNALKWARAFLAEIPMYLSMGGDLIFFDWNNNGVPDHIGEVDHKIDTETIATVEGNTGKPALVRKKVRPRKYVLGVFRPLYVPKDKLEVKRLNEQGNFEYQSVFMFQMALGFKKPTGILDKATVKAWQKKIGVTPDGSWKRKTSVAGQKFLKIKADGIWGKDSTIALQKWINRVCFPKPVTKPKPEPVKKGYEGTFPELPPKTAKIAVECAYSYGTKLSRYSYKDGKPKEAYKKWLDKEYPNRKGWKYAKSRAGASCDVFAGTDLRAAGYKDAPHAMSKMIAWCKKHLKAVKEMKNGDIVTRANHVAIALDLKGKMLVANAHYQMQGGTYPIIQTIKSAGGFTQIWRPEGLSYFSRGDTFTEIKHLKQFLNWYGNYGLNPDKYNIGNKTEAAINDFRTKEGMKPNGRFDEECLKKAKEARK